MALWRDKRPRVGLGYFKTHVTYETDRYTRLLPSQASRPAPSRPEPSRGRLIADALPGLKTTPVHATQPVTPEPTVCPVDMGDPQD